MIRKTSAIVLHLVNYSESSVIATLYTAAFGRQAYMINGIRSSRSKQKSALLQPLSLLDIEADHKPGRDIQRMKEFRLSEVYHSIPFDVVKSTVALFLAELLSKTLRSEEPDEDLFDFIFNGLHYFDSLEKGSANFHLWFIMKLLSYLGFGLHNNRDAISPWFDMKSGSFVGFRPVYPNAPDRDESAMLAQLIDLPIENIQQLSISGERRTRLLEVLLEYYHLHIDSLGSINSLKVLQDIFH
ncbi:DNA repair protein RecO [Roseimarinus sediminis]|jgi:DNA repair protein RecO (recombination protein O)|uniref:DNA repair protein RecO n=1 Tax=Roseimarinus sediminis TaxID=1610899 RepID=UPI003D1E46D0